MEGYEPYSMRQKRAERAAKPVVLEYDSIPQQMRGQAFNALAHIGGSEYDTSGFWKRLEGIIVREHGLYGRMPGDSRSYARDHYYRVANYLAAVPDIALFLDAVELGFREAQRPYVRHLGTEPSKHIQRQMRKLTEAVEELNSRFRKHNLSYAFVGFPGVIVRVDTDYVHAEMVEPAAAQLSNLGWHGPLDEFLAAHQHYRHGDYKSAMNEALKAFESTMKSILEARQWQYDEKWQAKHLINALFENGLISNGLECYFGGIRSVLESGVPMLRNQQSGHGQGLAVSEVPEYVAAFTLHLTAANILFLLSAHAASP